ncbi:formimidoylglutamate deiminase [Curtobacterium sp. MCBD17_028]|uniref:formimidoylglutamate deiminase n=1 Tax=Curtobacterium sp. MCBD17_028 TaxID=2175670 RepID=UPI000DA8EA4B|nr:formimidoylglutamate deiminase [Curtobacterium sp. MCBD17_028]PZE22970.1 formimidoylglutamate deiminase [Curtobacterium sp. MCBD17_028]
MRVQLGRLVLPDVVTGPLTVDLDGDGVVTAVEPGAGRADLVVDTAVPAFANTHSHAFHRLLRGRTNAGGGDFWTWRTRMYAVVAALDPDALHDVALAVYGEMVAAGYGAVGEFHYLHHRDDGTPYPAHDMELALAAAAASTGIRLTLLDTCYLSAGFGAPLEGAQRRFGDGSVERWTERWWALRDVLAREHPTVTLGAALHSVRAVSEHEAARAVELLPPTVPLHVHLSEQPAENTASTAATGLTPTALLDRAGALAARTTVVHATHLTDEDVRLLGTARVGVSMCPTTEADLGDGLGRAWDLADAGAVVSIGSDQNVVVDPFEELRGVERGARLAAGRRGVFTPSELWRAGGVDGHRALRPAGAPVPTGGPVVGAPFDVVGIDPRSVRTAGSAPEELLHTATAADVTAVVLGGRLRDPARARADTVAVTDRFRGGA